MNYHANANKSKIIDDTLNLRIGNTNKNAKVISSYLNFITLPYFVKVYVKANWNKKKIELLLTLKISTVQKTLKLTSKAMQINLSRTLQGTLYSESHKEQIGKSYSYVEVKLLFCCI